MTKTVTSVLSIPNKRTSIVMLNTLKTLKMGWISVEIIGVTRFSSFANDENLVTLKFRWHRLRNTKTTKASITIQKTKVRKFMKYLSKTHKKTT